MALVENFILKSLQEQHLNVIHNAKISKLVNLVNSKGIVDFMGELFYALTETYARYIDSNQSMMRFEQFIDFTRDFDIFPKLMSKASLYRIFKALALMNDAMSPKKELKNLTMNSFASLSPKNQQLKAFKNELIDENLFIEALTLCALDSSHDA